jgi:CopG family nickel-responsive transcriptional regulator
LCPTVYTGRSEVVLEGSLEEISTLVGKIRATKDTLTVDYSVLPVDDFGPLADMD